MQPKSKTKRLENLRNTPISIPLTSPPTPSCSSSSLPQFQNPNLIHPFFPIGSQVEVTSDEEGFRGAWYSATVIQPPSSKHNQQHQIFVEYNNLLSDENGSSLLKEFVDAEFIRPKPPVEENDKKSFDLNDVVDASYQDGWWCGVVTCIVSSKRYRVFFPSPPDEIEFDASDLRVHKNWVHGIWVLPEKQRMRDLNFSPGTAVEVNIDPESSCDVWFPATFIKQAANNLFLVEYQSSKEVGLQKLAVDSDHIRPSPPSSSNKIFNLLEKVDAFYDYRWLSGVVTKILADRRYIVYFKRTKKEKELSHADLRLHMEWNNGKWIHSSQDTSMTSNSEKRSNYIVNGGSKEKTRAPSEGSDAVKNYAGSDKHSIINLRSCQKELTPGNEKVSHSSAAPSIKNSKQTSVNGDDSYSRSSRRSNEAPASDVPLPPETCKSRMQQMDGSSYETSVDVDSPAPGHPEQSNLKQFEDSSQPSALTEMKVDYEKQSPLRKRGRPRIRPLLSGDAVGDTIEQTPNKSDVMKPIGSIVVGLTHNGKMIDTLGESSSQRLVSGHKNTVEDEAKVLESSSADHESVGSERQKEGEVTNLKRKRGRPPKVMFRLGSPQTKVAEVVEDEKEDEVSDAKDERCFPTNEVEKPIAIVDPTGISDSAPTDYHGKHTRKFTDHIKLLSDLRRLGTSTLIKQDKKKRKVLTEPLTLASDEPVKPVALRTVPLKKGRKRKHKPTKLVDPQRKDAVDNSRIAIDVFNNRVPREFDKVVAGTSSNASDEDRPLSAWFEGAHSPTTADAMISTGVTANQSGENGNRGEVKKTAPGALVEVNEQDIRNTSTENVSQVQDRNDEIPIQSQSTAIVLLESRDLPFVKNSLIWELIEKMEVLKRIPQKPHFRPLYNCKEECREGLAIGSMVTFTSLVERISKSCFSDPKSLLDGYLEALVDLEGLGFNVEPVREQLNKMISIKGKYEHAQGMSKELESQIMEHSSEKSKIDEEVEELDKKIAELREKRALVISRKEIKDAEITLLQTSVDAVKSALVNAEEEFEKVATSLW